MTLSDNREFKNPAAVLSAIGLEEMRDTTLKSLPFEEFGSKDGSYNDDTDFRFMSYTFYLKTPPTSRYIMTPK